MWHSSKFLEIRIIFTKQIFMLTFMEFITIFNKVFFFFDFSVLITNVVNVSTSLTINNLHEKKLFAVLSS